eukprot:2748103-Prymnesium_polylepis.2
MQVLRETPFSERKAMLSLHSPRPNLSPSKSMGQDCAPSHATPSLACLMCDSPGLLDAFALMRSRARDDRYHSLQL